MTNQDFSGRWKGEYVYGETYNNSIRGTTIPFEISITVTEGHLKGECVDNETKDYFDNPAIIEGIIKGGTIHFIKRYPCFFTYDESRKLMLFPKLPSHEIHYSGSFSNGQFSGDWEFKVTYAAEENEDMEYIGKGYWKMEKV